MQIKKVIDINNDARFIILRDRDTSTYGNEAYKSSELRLEFRCDYRVLGFLWRPWKLWRRKTWGKNVTCTMNIIKEHMEIMCKEELNISLSGFERKEKIKNLFGEE